MKTYDALALFSGGLDSILAIKIVQEQGVKVKCLHCVTPFFGKAHRCEHWQRVYDMDIDVIDVGDAFVRMLHTRPKYGFGKTMNPCVDCKILLMRTAHSLMPRYGARFVISGEVLGQRPMSQRRDTLFSIRRESGLGDVLLRPLSAQLLPPTVPEQQGWVDRERLYSIAGRGRTQQLVLAQKYHIHPIPTPGGGCRLAEKENARRYWPVLQHMPQSTAEDFTLANAGRQLWTLPPYRPHWLCIGRDAADNDALEALARPADIRFTLGDMPGPVGLARPLGAWSIDILHSAAACVASYAQRAVRHAATHGSVQVYVSSTDASTPSQIFAVLPERRDIWQEMPWEDVRQALHLEALSRHE